MNEHARPNETFDPEWADPDTAVAFLRSIRPAGPWNLSAIVPDHEGVESVTLTDLTLARAWVAERAGRANIYYAPNAAPRPTGFAGRALKSDVPAFQFAHVDIDLDRLPASDPLSALPTDQRKRHTIEQLTAFQRPGAPSHVIDSGGGVQALWRMDAAQTFTERSPAEQFELINIALIDILGGDRGTHDVGRLLRLPGTVNWPNAKKRARGRVVAPALLIEANENAYSDWLFPVAQPRIKAENIDIEFGPPDEVADLDALTEQYGLSNRLVEILINGRLPESKSGDDSRSAWLFDAVCGLVRVGVPNETILAIMLDATLGISESVLERGADAERYAEHTLRSALGRAGDGPDATSSSNESPGPSRGFAFTAYKTRDPATIQPRQWLLKPDYVRQFTTGTLAHGGVGKSTLLTTEALAMASGKPLLGVSPRSRLKVALWNGEDPMDELVRKVEAARKHFRLAPEAVDGWLYLNSGRDLPITIARQDKTGTKIATPEVQALVASLINNKIDVLIVDPFVSTHQVAENDNSAIEQVARTWNEVAETANCSVHLAHHAVKARGRDAEGMDFRGGGAALAKLRRLRVLNPLQAKNAAAIGIRPEQAPQYFRSDTGKGNLSLPSANETWFQLISVDLCNGEEFGDDSDLMGVVQQWVPPELDLDPSCEAIAAIFVEMGDKVWRKTAQAGEDWVGSPIAKVLKLDVKDSGVRKRIQQLVLGWDASGVLKLAKPQESDAHGNKREGYVAGKLPEDEDGE